MLSAKRVCSRPWRQAVDRFSSEKRLSRTRENTSSTCFFFSFPLTPLSLFLSFLFFSPKTKNLHHPAAALNPTYTYGKRADSGGNAAPSAVSGWTRTDASSSSPSRTSSPVEIAAAKAAAGTGASTPPLGTPPLGATPPKKVYDHHGHKGDLLLNPLPDVLPAEKA